jgi:hypothetical protein
LKKLFLLLLLSTSFSFAQTTTTAPDTKLVTKQKPSLADRLRAKDFRLNIFSWGYGPGIKNPTSNSVDINGEPSLEAANWVLMNFNAPIGKDWRLALIPGFVSSPARKEGTFRLMNTALGLQRVLYTTPSYTYFFRGDLVLPTAESSRSDDMQYGAQFLNVFSYRPVGKKVGIGFVVVPGTKEYGDGTSNQYIYTNPTLSYYLSDTFQWILMSEHFYGNSRNSAANAFIRTDPDFMGLGFRKTWTYSKDRNLFIQPYLNFYPQNPRTDNTHLALWFASRAF